MQHEKRPALAATGIPGAGMSKSRTKDSTKPTEVPLDDVLVDRCKWPLLPEGEYLMAYTHHETAVVFKTPKVFVHLRITEPGPHLNQRLYAPYRVTELIGRPGKNGRFKLRHRSELYLTLCWLYEARRLRPDRVSLRDLKRLLPGENVKTTYARASTAECTSCGDLF